ncbi:MAG: GyrI-like domain-containing protein [Candidatus Zixiibacteriota bacterium]
MELQIKHLEPMRVACIRHIGPYQECTKAWEALFKWATEKKIDPKTTHWIGASYDDPETTPAEKLRYDACVVVSGDIQADDTVEIKNFPGGKYAYAVHKGPYRNMGQTFKAIFTEGFPKAGLEWRMEACLEFYPGECDGRPEEELITELYVPVK